VEAQRAGEAARLAAARAAFRESQAALSDVRGRAANLTRDVSGDAEYRDVNYVFPTFVTTWLPVGLVGLMIAAIFAAAMSSVAAELNALSTATVIDFYRRSLRPAATDRETLIASKVATGFWGVFASVIATYAVNLGALIEVVNKLGSFFYGSLFGVFLLAIAFPRARAAGAFWGLIAGMASVAAVGLLTSVAYLWQNVIGTVVVVAVGLAISAVTKPRPAAA
jgi:Na+/proline symporter